MLACRFPDAQTDWFVGLYLRPGSVSVRRTGRSMTSGILTAPTATASACLARKRWRQSKDHSHQKNCHPKHHVRCHSEDGYRLRRALTVDGVPPDYPAMHGIQQAQNGRCLSDTGAAPNICACGGMGDAKCPFRVISNRFAVVAQCPLLPGGFNWSAQHLLILRDEEVFHGDVTD